jgi:hypothetical protein
VAGPALFTLAWVAGSLRQAGHPAAGVQLSGLAAEDARDPQIMVAGFVALGACSIVFGAGLGRMSAPRQPGRKRSSTAGRKRSQTAGGRLSRPAGRWLRWPAGAGLVVAAGAAAVAAGVFRRDHMLLTGPGFGGESWHNQVHDVASAVAYGAMIAAPVLLGRRFRDEPEWAALSRPVLGLAAASAVSLAVFVSRAAEPWNGVVQRAAVTLALAAEVIIAARMMMPPAAGPARPGRRPARRRSFSGSPPRRPA